MGEAASEDQEVLGISLTDTTPLEDLFNKSNLSIDKELDGFYEPTLFDLDKGLSLLCCLNKEV